MAQVVDCSHQLLLLSADLLLLVELAPYNFYVSSAGIFFFYVLVNVIFPALCVSICCCTFYYTAALSTGAATDITWHTFFPVFIECASVCQCNATHGESAAFFFSVQLSAGGGVLHPQYVSS